MKAGFKTWVLWQSYRYILGNCYDHGYRIERQTFETDITQIILCASLMSFITQFESFGSVLPTSSNLFQCRCDSKLDDI